jgi:hypothetical protein
MQQVYRTKLTGPYHDFWLCSSDLEDDAYIEYVSKKSSVQLADDLYSYCYDSFSWIPTYNPASASMRFLQGLNRYGPCLIRKESADIFYQVIAGWRMIFSQGPAELVLNCGSCGIRLDDDLGYRQMPYEVVADRDSLVATLDSLLGYAEQVKTGKYCILQLGI